MLRASMALLLIGATAYAAPAADRRYNSDEERLSTKLAGLVPGAPQTCISPSRSESGDHAGNLVLTKDRSGVLYAAHFQGGCRAEGSDALISQRTTSEICRGDIVEIRDLTSGVSRGACSYSEFTPYRRPR